MLWNSECCREQKHKAKKGLSTSTGQSPWAERGASREQSSSGFPQCSCGSRAGTCPALDRAWLAARLGSVPTAAVTFAEDVQADSSWARHRALTQCTASLHLGSTPASCAAPFLGLKTILTIYIDDNLLISTYVNIITHGLPSQKISWIKGNLIVLVIFRQMQLVKQNHLQQSAPKGFSVY